MADRYQQLADSPPGRFLVKRLGLPRPTPLRRYQPGQPVLDGPALVGGAVGGRLLGPTLEILRAVGADIHVTGQEHVQEAARAAGAGARTTVWSAQADGDSRFAALVFDASGVARSEELSVVYEFFQPVVRMLRPSGRLLLLGTPPATCETARQATAQRALEGFLRSVGKELRGGATAQLVLVAPGAERGAESTLRFLLSAKSAYVSGQVVTIGDGEASAPEDWDRQLAGKTALVTGASRGIGEAIAATLARDGASVVCLDVPAQGEALASVANRIGGSALQLDITAEGAPQALAQHLRDRHGGVDVVVHNAGVTRDKTLARMDGERWDPVIAVNLTSQERIDDALLADETLRPGGRIVCVSSTSGIGGNAGQTNYATSKAGVIGMVEAMAPALGGRPATINAVAPGFIETQMTAAMPVTVREAGRRMNSLSQGGQPVDVAETVAWLASPATGGINGSVVRVCGQALFGA
jgi:3-oxoacyl-[acyl-carrier protein] reductase